MVIVVFLLNLFAFSCMFGAFGLSYIMYRKEGETCRYYYLWYIGVSWIWFVSQFYGFVHVSLLSSTNIGYIMAMGIIRTIVSLIVVYVAPLLMTCIALGTVPNRIRVRLTVIPAGVAVLALIIIISDSQVLAEVFSFIVNAMLGIGFLFTRVTVRRRKRDFRAASMIPFLWITGIAFLLFAVYGVLFIFIESPHKMLIDTLTTGLFITAWCLNDLLIFLRELTCSFGKHETVPGRFTTLYQITPREQEIIAGLLTGMSYKQIADRLCISTRTVETHVYRIFRKCEVNNKVELLNLLRTYL